MPSPSKSGFLLAELFVPELKELLDGRQFDEIKELIQSLSLVDLAECWEKFTPKEQTILFRLLAGREASSLFQELEPEEQTHILDSLANKELEGLLDDFDPEEAVRVFHELPEKTVKHMYSLLEKEQRLSVDKIYKYPDNTIGSWMHIQRIDLSPSMTSARAINQIRSGCRLKQGGGPDGYYVTDKTRKVLGMVMLRELIAAPPKMKISEYMSPVRLIQLDPNHDQEDAIHLFTKYKLSTAPVVDKNYRLLGYIQAEDIIPLVEEEVSEDMAKMAGTASEELESKSIWQTTRIRFPWLIATCFGQLMVAFVIHHFNFVLSQIIALASFLPFIAAMGGNVGAQSSTILVRSMALREYHRSDAWRLLLKESGIGLILGVTYGFAIGGMAYLMYGTQFGDMFSFVIGLGTVVSMTVATIFGVIGPLTLVKCGADPATATGPLITTFIDIIGTLSYFLLAVSFLM